MKAITQEKYGVMGLAEIEPPTCEPGTVLVRVRAASINARDWHIMRGDPYLARLTMMGARRPRTRIRGTDFAGTVEAVGAGVDSFQPGDEVFGDLGDAHGAFASLVCAPAETIEFKPAGISFSEAAALPLAGSTALMGLRDVGRVRPGARVLINGASGGVGTYAVQIAKALGAHVTAVCSTRNVDLVRSLGADEVVDYKVEDFATAVTPYEVVFDLVGNRSLRDLRRVLAPRGTLVLSGGGTFRGRPTLLGPMKLILGAQLAARFSRLRMVVLSVPPSRALLTGLRELVEAGRLTSVIDRTYPLAEVPEAIRYMEAEHVRAKVVITV
ncbi:NAD(P)-dependent alcohol dehydrogenase [Paractinoplanes brasiliensis]|uniref:NADPH:quinone reductase-like Zn-dependent oxidoreductase n=1 Tax=Paractinoplanes brasiliensis TaxID=52695 RepID=A0A4R6JST8_9ACTN|nr:NAD(P)-dependent alcohol dehydrogenase [Actinoplanes brasiliensis]TDO37725.1 NADPH:quinone reductase-like Zn-dependent oxidoreductase [Actinoplanes brasiliensis]GID32064.1 NADPH:quinone reductase [Actinoplanes brasiliensis]